MNLSSSISHSPVIENRIFLRDRIVFVIIVFFILFSVVVGRLFYLGHQERDYRSFYLPPDISLSASRPRILDRHGSLLAIDIPVYSLFAEPHRIASADDVYESLSTVLPDLDFESTIRKLRSSSNFVWLRRELTPSKKQEILDLGLPALGFRSESKRFYPSGRVVSHILGLTNIDNQGISGIEKYLDDVGLRDLQSSGFALHQDLESVYLSVDLRVQQHLRDSLLDALSRYDAIAAAGIVIDANTGEILALSSLPDFDPNNPTDVNHTDRLNRVSSGLFEMGSTFKAFTTAMALDSGKVRLSDSFDASRPLTFGEFTISDFHAQNRVLTVSETFIHSSNIATVKMARRVGIDSHRDFLSRAGLLDRVSSFELPEVARPIVPRHWTRTNSATISYGHGISTTPLQTAYGISALLNGGMLHSPTLLRRSVDDARSLSTSLISAETSSMMRYLFFLNSRDGSGRSGVVDGLWIGGKTGTSEKVIDGKYSKSHRFNSYVAAFPIHSPRYVVLVILDEPKVEEGEVSATAGMNVVPTVGRIIERLAPVLGVFPNFNLDLSDHFDFLNEPDTGESATAPDTDSDTIASTIEGITDALD